MGSVSKQKSSSNSTYAPTQQAGAAYNNILSTAQNTANTAYNPATNQNVAGFNDTQNAAFGGINSSINNFQPLLNNAIQMGQAGSAPISPQQIQQYMDPYIGSVVDATRAQMEHTNAVQNNALIGNQAANNALGNNRTGIALAEAQRGQSANMNSAISQLYSSGFGQALGAAQADQNRQLQGSANMGNLANQQQNQTLAGLMAQLSAGNQQQTQAQNVNNANTANAQASTMWPYQNTQWLASIAGALGPLMGGTTTGTQTGTTTQGKGAGQVAGSALSALAMFSDRRMKEDISHIGHLHDGQKIYKFRYKGDPKFHVGLMADEVEQHHPESVSTGPGGMKMVNYDQATEDAEPAGYASGGAIPYAPGGSVGFGGGASYFPWAELRSAAPQMPALQMPSASSQTQQPSFDPQKSFQLGKSARAGFDSLTGGTSNSLSGLNSLFDFAVGGGVDFGDNPFGIDPRTGRIKIPEMKTDSIGEIGPSTRGGIDYPSSDDSGRVIDLPDGGPMDTPSAGVPPVGMRGAPPMPGADESMPKLTGAPNGDPGIDAMTQLSNAWQKEPVRPAPDDKLDFNGDQFGLYGRKGPAVPLSPGAVAGSNMLADLHGGMPDAVSSPADAAVTPPSAGFTPQTETHSAGPGQSTLDFIRNEESWHPRTIRDGRQYTNGWGTRALSANEPPLNKAEADRRLMAETNSIETFLDRNVKVPMTPQQRTGLVSFGFNAGQGALSRLLPQINAGDWKGAADHLIQYQNAYDANGQKLTHINRETGERENALLPRRLREAALLNQTEPLPEGSPATAGGDVHPAVRQAVAKATSPDAPVVSSYSSPQDRHTGGLLKRWFGVDFNPLKLDEDERLAMLHAGLSMMQTGNIGSGVKGVEFLRDTRQQNLENQMKMMQLNAGQIHQTGVNAAGQPQFSIFHPMTSQIEPIGGGNSAMPASFGEFPADVQEQAKAIAEGRKPMPTPSKGNPSAVMVGQAARMLDPGLDEGRYKFRQGWDDDKGGWVQKTLTANRTAMVHSAALDDLVEKLPDSGVGPLAKTFNEGKNWWSGENTNPTLLAWKGVADKLATEMVRVMNPTTGGGEKERIAELEKLNPANGHAALHNLIKTYTERLNERTQAMSTMWKQKMGGAEMPELLDAESKGAIEKLNSRYGPNAAPPATPTVPRPQGVTDDMVIKQGEAALRRGVPRSQVEAQARAYGVDPERLRP